MKWIGGESFKRLLSPDETRTIGYVCFDHDTKLWECFGEGVSFIGVKQDLEEAKQLVEEAAGGNDVHQQKTT